MNELQTLNNLVTEIKFFENQAVTSYWEIGKRLAQAKEQVGHGNWESWLKDNLNYSQNMAGKLIRICQTIPKSDLNQNLNFTQVYALTTVDEETRNEIIKNENLEDKTVKETQEIIKKYKEKAEDLEEENQGLKEANKELTDLIENQPIVEKEVIREVKPSDYDDIKRENQRLLRELDLKRKEIVDLKLIESAKYENLEKKEKQEKIVADINRFAWDINAFISNCGGLLYLTDYLEDIKPSDRKLFIRAVKSLMGWTYQINENITKWEV